MRRLWKIFAFHHLIIWRNYQVIGQGNIVFASTNNFGCALAFILQKLETLRLWIKKGEVMELNFIEDILHDRRKITINTSLRLAKLFGVSDEYFINMQNDIDIRMQKRKLDFELQQIKTIQYA